MKVNISAMMESAVISAIAFVIAWAWVTAGLYLAHRFGVSEVVPAVLLGLAFVLVYINLVNDGSWVVDGLGLFAEMVLFGLVMYLTVLGAALVSYYYAGGFILVSAVSSLFFNGLQPAQTKRKTK
jgi:sorbitol-specific phosphotransferase system component IIBC